MRSFFYTIRQAFLQFGRNFNMGLASIFAITAMLLILSVFFIAALNVNIAAQTIKGDYDTIEIYLKDKVKEKRADVMIEDLKATDGVEDAYYKSKKKAMKEFKERWGENGYLLDNLEKNPLPNSISFSKGVGYPKSGDYGVTIAFYGIIIVGGAIISYFVADHALYAKYGKHGILDTLFLVAFPMGLIGARLWWCIVLEPGQIFYGNFGESFIRLVDVRKGGMAIQGGALLGMISGIWFALKFRKYINIRWLVDVCVPTILIAQAVGRWGNFFNQEVYGMASDASSWWFLPKMIQQNMVIYSSIDSVRAFRVPLFLIESVINMAGYFIIRYAIGHGLKKFLRQGDLGFLYVAWYGLVRVSLEPLRSGFTLDLGSSAAFGYLQSWIVAFVMVAVGILGMVGIRIFEKIRISKGKEVKQYEAI